MTFHMLRSDAPFKSNSQNKILGTSQNEYFILLVSLSQNVILGF